MRDDKTPANLAGYRSLAMPGVKFWLRLSVSALMIGYLGWQVDLTTVRAAIGSIRWEFWIVALTIYLTGQSVSAWRWANLARAVGFNQKTTYFQRRYFEGMFFSLCLPTSIGGDIIKAWKLGATASGRFLAGCTVLVDRATGLLALLMIGTVAWLVQIVQPTPWEATGGIVVIGVASIGALQIGLLLWRLVADRLQRLPRLGHVARSLRPYDHQPGILARAIGLSLVIQSSNAILVWCIALSMGIDISLTAFFIAVPAAALASLLPSISGLGVREAALAFFLGRYGLSQEMGITIGLLWFLIVVLGGLIGGVVYLVDRRVVVNEAGGVKTIPASVSGEALTSKPLPNHSRKRRRSQPLAQEPHA